VRIDGFSRPVLQFSVKPHPKAPAVQVYVCHFKSKAPTQLASEAWFKAQRDDPPDAALRGEASRFEYWSLGRKDGGFGDRFEPLKRSDRQGGVEPEKFLPLHEEKLTKAITRYILGRDPFIAKENPDYPGYTEYDQLMRLEEWVFEARGDTP
jgi:hypothetical protein